MVSSAPFTTSELATMQRIGHNAVLYVAAEANMGISCLVFVTDLELDMDRRLSRLTLLPTPREFSLYHSAALFLGLGGEACHRRGSDFLRWYHHDEAPRCQTGSRPAARVGE